MSNLSSLFVVVSLLSIPLIGFLTRNTSHVTTVVIDISDTDSGAYVVCVSWKGLGYEENHLLTMSSFGGNNVPFLTHEGALRRKNYLCALFEEMEREGISKEYIKTVYDTLLGIDPPQQMMRFGFPLKMVEVAETSWRVDAWRAILNISILAIVTIVVKQGTNRLVASYRRRRGRCINCGYPLFESVRCPECGNGYELSLPKILSCRVPTLSLLRSRCNATGCMTRGERVLDRF